MDRYVSCQLITVRMSGVERLLYAETVEDQVRHPSSWTTDVFAVPGRGGTTVVGSVRRAVLTSDGAQTFATNVSSGHVVIDGQVVAAGPFQRRPTVIVPVHYSFDPDAGYTLHPDGRYTYRLDEWWNTDETVVDWLWESREFSAVAEAVASRTGLRLQDNSDRIGNVLRFTRLSSVVVHRSHGKHAVRVRAFDTEDRAPERGLTASVRFLFGNETVAERVVSLPADGAEVALDQDYSATSVSVYDSATGNLLYREHGNVFGPVTTRIGHPINAMVPDSKGRMHGVSWTHWEGPRPHAIDPKEPWRDRSSRRTLRNRKLREALTARFFRGSERTEAEDMLRNILARESSEFVYIWDPYFDDSAALDFLGWIDPDIKCRILCGAPLKGKAPLSLHPEVAALSTALTTLRSPPLRKQLECRFKVLAVKKGYRPIYHDRFIISGRAAWCIGTSFNSVGTKIGAVVRLLNPDPIRWHFEDEWAAMPRGVVKVDI